MSGQILSFNECETMINLIKKNVENEMLYYQETEIDFINHSFIGEDNQELEKKKVETEVNFDLERLNAIIKDLDELYVKYY